MSKKLKMMLLAFASKVQNYFCIILQHFV